MTVTDQTVPRPLAWRHGHSLRPWLLFGLVLAMISVATTTAVKVRSRAARSTLQLRTQALGMGPIAAKISATGALSALVTVSVGSQVSGRIASLRADFGDHVKRGQVIATIDPSLFRAAVTQAGANHAAAVAALMRARAQQTNTARQYARSHELFSQQLISRADHDASEAAALVASADVAAAEAVVLQASAALEQSRLNLRYTTIASPIDGVIISRNVDVGQVVAATLQAPTLFTIAQDLTRMQVHASIAEADVGNVHEGMTARFTVDAYPERGFEGRVTQVRDNAQSQQNVVTYDAVIDVDNTDRLLKPGMTANVSVTYAQRDHVLRAPNAALRFKPDRATLAAAHATEPPVLQHPDQRTLWLRHGAELTPSVVRIGISDGVWTEVLHGAVHAADEVVLEASPASGANP